MSQRIVNIGNGYRMDRLSAEMAIEACSAEWVEEGKSVRSLTPEEAITARNEQARLAALRAPLPYAEVHGLRFEPSASGTSATRREGLLMWQAHDFAVRAAA